MNASPRPRFLATGAAAVTVVPMASAFVSIRSAGDACSPGAPAASPSYGATASRRRGCPR